MSTQKPDRKIEDIYPLSPMQQGMLFHSVLDSTSPVYTERYTYSIEGPLNISNFAKAWEHVGKSHPIFRTIFKWEGLDKPLQVVVSDRLPEYNVHDLRSMAPEEIEKEIKAIEFEDQSKHFDLSKGPLMRLTVMMLPGSRFNFIWTYHHILMDGWCLSHVMKDLFISFISLEEGKALPALKRPAYKNYIAWLAKQDSNAAISYWKGILNDFSSPTMLPYDKSRSRHKPGNFGKLERKFSLEKTRLLNEKSRNLRVTLSTMVQAAWGILLGRFSNVQDVVFGVTISGRPAELAGSEEMLGLFINSLPVRVKLDGKVEDMLKDLQQQSLKIQELGFSFLPDVKAASSVPGNLELFNSLVIFENYPTSYSGANIYGDIRIADFNAAEMTHFDLTLVIRPGDEMVLCLEYANDAFSEDLIGRMLEYMENILAGMVEKPQGKALNVPVMSEQERNKVLNEFNDTEMDYPKDATLVELFEQRAEESAMQPAVVFNDTSLTYDELNCKANKLARVLRDKGISQGVLAGMMTGKPVETVVSILGILKAGGAYMPIDPDFPETRIRYMIEDSRTPVVVCTEALRHKLPPEQQVILIDSGWDRIEEHDGDNPGYPLSSDDLAYAIYTSGSTGKPKGSLIPHKGVVNLVYSLKNILYSYYEGPLNVAQLASFTFDASVQQIFASLILGHTLFPIPSSIKKDMNQLIPYILKNNIEVIDGTPSLWELLVANGIMNEPPLKIRHVIIGGEALPVDMMERYYEGTYGKSTRWTNVYGVTESSVDSTSYTVNLNTLARKDYAPIGSPLGNTQIYILDEFMNPVPVGISGEIFIGGHGLAKGYLNNPEKTKENFIKNPFRENETIYKTGDLGRWLSDGNVEFLGRMDFQVKIRGFRIELAEIESVLFSYPDITDGVVMDRKDAAGDRYLAAYYVSEKDIPASELRTFMAGELPDFMVPSYFIRLDALPLNTSGKVDRGALPKPEDVGQATGTEYVEPASETEKAIAAIWQTILGVEKIGLKDNFFDLGGHSLKATRVISKIKKDLGYEIPLKVIFETPTIEGLCNAIPSKSGSDEIEVLEKRQSYELSHAQERLWFLDKLMPESGAYNIPVPFIIDGPLDIDVMKKALNHIVGRHELLRTVFPAVNGDPVQVVEERFEADLMVKDAIGISGQGMIDIVTEEAFRPFDLASGPLFRVRIYRISKNSHLFMMVMHHIVSDGWSVGILLKDLMSVYGQILSGREPALPEIKVHYKDFAAWQNEQLEKGKLKGQEEFWLKALGGELPVLNLPTDRERPVLATSNGDMFTVSLDGDMSAGIRKIVKEKDVTIFMFMLAVLDIYLGKICSVEDVIVGTPIAGRTRSEIEDIVGLFVNTLALRTDLGGDPDFDAMLGRVKKTCMDAYANQDYPFDRLIEIINPVRDTSRSPIFNVMLSMQDVSELMKLTSFGDITIKPAVSEYRTSKFDLTIFTVDTGSNIELSFEYNTDLFDRNTMERYAAHISHLIGEIIEKPNLKIGKYSILTPEEQEQILKGFNATDAWYPEEKCWYELFEEQVEKTPDNEAVIFDDVCLTYRELNEKANKLGNYLRKLGVEKETKVGILAERSLDILVAIVGIHKAGGCYVPMDPAYPRARLQYMLEDSESPVVVTQERLLGELAASDAAVVAIDRDWPEIDKESGENSARKSNPENLSHLIYTSGSTGLPKGVMIEHRNVTAFLSWSMSEFSYDEYEHMIASTSMCFDLSVYEFLLPLITGAKLTVLRSSLDIDDYLENHTCTMINTVPSALRHLISVAGKRHRIKAINLAGEPLKLDLVTDAYAAIDSDMIRNLYGPTEDTTYSTNYRVPKGITFQPLIGRPLSNGQAYVLDKSLMPVPVGVKGEIYLSGAGLARGYWKAPEKTAQRFIPNPFSERYPFIYKTGDLGSWLPDGNLVFHGRVDYQVKIRGNRIEMGEIEVRLAALEKIIDVVVVDKDDRDGNKYLVCYYSSESEIHVAELREHIQEKLPEYMVPSRFIHMDALPLTPNGKVDRKALPEPGDVQITQMSEYAAPSNDTERLLAEVWQEVLGVARIGVNDNFFDLGGHSLLIMKVLTKLKLRLPLTIQDFFEHQTIAKLSEKLSEKTVESGKPAKPLTMVEEKKEVKIDIEISGKKERPENILLTGATGYLGAHILYELLNRTDANVHCLIRAESGELAGQRIRDMLNYYFAGELIETSRIIPVRGDISIDGLGLDSDSLNLLKKADTIIHSAADVRHFGNYSHFENINTFGTKRITGLAMAGACRRFHHISTLSVSGDYIPEMAKAIFYEADFDRGQVIGNVYSRSKFEAESIVREAMKNGLNATIYRAGNLVGDSATGKFQPNIEENAFYTSIRDMIGIGMVPEGIDPDIEMTPIDCCRRVFIELMLTPETGNRCLHLFNPNTVRLSELIDAICASGFKVSMVKADDYIKTLGSLGSAGGNESSVAMMTEGHEARTHYIYDNSCVDYFMKYIGIEWPLMNEAVLSRMINYCVSSGFIKKTKKKRGKK